MIGFFDKKKLLVFTAELLLLEIGQHLCFLILKSLLLIHFLKYVQILA